MRDKKMSTFNRVESLEESRSSHARQFQLLLRVSNN